jgi:hypothetical protein
MVMDDAGQALPGRWVKAAVAVLIRLPTEEARRHWLEQHEDEVAEINAAKPEYAAALEQVAVTGERPRPTVDEDKARLEALLADLHRAGTVQRRDDLLQEYAPRAADILARRPPYPCLPRALPETDRGPPRPTPPHRAARPGRHAARTRYRLEVADDHRRNFCRRRLPRPAGR